MNYNSYAIGRKDFNGHPCATAIRSSVVDSATGEKLLRYDIMYTHQLNDTGKCSICGQVLRNYEDK